MSPVPSCASLAIACSAAFSILAVGSASAQTPPAEPIQVFRDGDATLGCRQIADEAATLSQTMGGSEGGGVFGSVGEVAKSGAALLIPGVGLAMAGADALTRPERERREAQARAVEHRWYYLNGLYAGLRCQEAAAPAVAPPAPAPPGGDGIAIDLPQPSPQPPR